MKLLKVILLLGVIGNLGACQKQAALGGFDGALSEKSQINTMGSSGLARSSWKLVSISDKKTSTNVASYGQTLSFDPLGQASQNQKFSGRAACNNYGGEFIDKEGAISNMRLMATSMSCANQRIEEEYLSSLDLAVSYMVKGEILTIHCQNEVVLGFTRH